MYSLYTEEHAEKHDEADPKSVVKPHPAIATSPLSATKILA